MSAVKKTAFTPVYVAYTQQHTLRKKKELYLTLHVRLSPVPVIRMSAVKEPAFTPVYVAYTQGKKRSYTLH